MGDCAIVLVGVESIVSGNCETEILEASVPDDSWHRDVYSWTWGPFEVKRRVPGRGSISFQNQVHNPFQSHCVTNYCSPLSTNSLSNLYKKLHFQGGLDNDHLFAAIDMYDEHISHWLWIAGLALFEWSILAVQITLPGTNVKYASRPNVGGWTRLSLLQTFVPCFLGCGYGVLYFCHNIEGGTAALGIGFSFWVLFQCAKHNHLLRISPVVIFYCISHIVTLGLFWFWWQINDGALPEFSAIKGNRVNQFFAGSDYNKVREL